METRQRFSHQMADVYQVLLRMGALVEEALYKALTAAKLHDKELADEVINKDYLINECQYQIEDKCTLIIATEQPVASDLRELITLIKIVSDLERIGDHARHLAKIVHSVRESLLLKFLPNIIEMTEHGIQMVHLSLNALVNKDSQQATVVAKMDAHLDHMHEQCFLKIVAVMKESPEQVEEGTSLIFLNRFLERLGDHVTNICEWIVYARTGKHTELND